ncbi:MAG: hypothetical protein KJ921_13825 [Proteobacteria bacterium]|nr:hypothetical protein [Pseudomonadota bacterium]
MFDFILLPLFEAVFRALTGRLFTQQQIKSITSHTIGKYFSDFFPTPKEDRDARQKVEEAREHIATASNIIGDIQKDLEGQEQKLSALLEDVEKNKGLADHYRTLAETNGEKFKAFRTEMEEALRNELTKQAENGRRRRQIAAIAIWLFTLFSGAVLGTYFKDIWKWVYSFLQ